MPGDVSEKEQNSQERPNNHNLNNVSKVKKSFDEIIFLILGSSKLKTSLEAPKPFLGSTLNIYTLITTYLTDLSFHSLKCRKSELFK
jgi:hypothetical protein